MPRFRPVQGAPFNQRDADIICPELTRLARANGTLDKHLVLEAARRRGSPLRPYILQHNTEEAAERWYLSQAQKVIRSFEVAWNEDGEERYIRLYNWVRMEAPAEEDAEEQNRGRGRGRGRGHSDDDADGAADACDDADDAEDTTRQNGTYVMMRADHTIGEPGYIRQILADAQAAIATFRRKCDELRRLLPDYRESHPREFRQVQRFLQQYGCDQ